MSFPRQNHLALCLGVLFFQVTAVAAADAPASGQMAILIGGGASADNNNYRYENNLRLFHNVLSEQGYTPDFVRTYFNEGKDSKVRDQFAKNAPKTIEDYGVGRESDQEFRLNNIRDLINGPAHLDTIKTEFDRVADLAAKKKISGVTLFTTDHGTPNTTDYSKSYITLAGDQKLGIEDEEKFVIDLEKSGTMVSLIGTQCFSGHNMTVAFQHPNACAFAAAASYESSWGMGDVKDLASKEGPGKVDDVPPRGYSEYSFYFSCAFHRKKVTGTQAAAHCPKDRVKPEKDGPVTLAEAHYYALTHMDPRSSPKISSEEYARTVLKRIKAAPATEDLVSLARCEPGSRIKIAGLDALKDPIAAMRIESFRQTQRKALQTLLSDSELLDLIHASKKDPLEERIKRIQQRYGEFEQAREDVLADIKAALKGANEEQEKEKQIKIKAAERIVKFGDKEFKKRSDRMAAIEKELFESKKLTPDARQVLQSEYNLLYGQVDLAIHEEMKDIFFAKDVEALRVMSDRKKQDYRNATAREEKILSQYAPVRRAYELLEAQHAVNVLLTKGTDAEKAKLMRLYECENRTL